MKLDTLFENYDLLMDSPNSTVKMRKLILQLAVQGKLVEQDPADEAAGELLKRIKAEKEKRIAEGKIKKQKPLPSVTEDEIPYELPQGWESIRIGNAINMINGRAFKPLEWNTVGLPILRIQNLNNPVAPYNYCDFDVDQKFHLKDDDFLISWSGTPGTSFGAFIWDRGPAVLNQHIFRCELYGDSFFGPYLRLAIKAQLDEMISQAHGGVGLQHITKDKLAKIVVTLPPFAEQKRIVAKVDQLMQLCDQLEACQKKAATKYESLNDAALERLLSAKNIEEFAEHWQFLCNNFDFIYNDPAHVNKLRQAILQLAVQGKLAPRPYRRTRQRTPETHQSRKRKTHRQRKNQKPLQPITENKIPYELPNSWEWVSLGELGEINPRINVDNNEIYVSFIPMKMISEKYGTPHSFDRRKWAEVKKGFTYFMNNDVGLAKITPCFENGKSTVFKGLLNGVGAGTTELHIFRQDSKLILPEYALIFFKCPKFLNDAKEKMTGTAGQKRIPRDFVRLVPFPLPSISEQKRIVAKVDQLMNFCDELETRLNQSEKDSEMLMQAVLYETFS